MSISILFESHATTFDNEAKIASGWNDAKLSPTGLEQAKQMGVRRADENFDAVFASDVSRSYETAEIAMAGRAVPIIRDARLRECDYGDFTGRPSVEVEAARQFYIDKAFPNGESYRQTSERMKSFLIGLLADYDGKRVLIVGHRATQYGLDYWINHIPLETCVTTPWHWQPGWEYRLEEI